MALKKRRMSALFFSIDDDMLFSFNSNSESLLMNLLCSTSSIMATAKFSWIAPSHLQLDGRVQCDICLPADRVRSRQVATSFAPGRACSSNAKRIGFCGTTQPERRVVEGGGFHISNNRQAVQGAEF